MQRLSKRMKTIADMVTPGRVVADIGCDHGLVSIYLIENNVSPKVYAMDVAEGPLDSARKNISASSVEAGRIEVRLSDGFESLEPGEADAAVISGMGGQLIISILEGGKKLYEKGFELVLSPQSDIPMVRTYLRKSGFVITDEEMLEEDGKYYNVIKCVFGLHNADGSVEPLMQDSILNTSSLGDKYGTKLIEKASPVFKNYLQKQIEKRESVFCRLSRSDSSSAVDRMAEVRTDIEEMTQILDSMG